MKPSQVLDLAADKLERDGWCQGGVPETGDNHKRAIGDLDGIPTCALLAFPFCYNNEDVPDRCTYDAETLLCRAIGADGGSLQEVFEWNDAPGRTKEEVIAMLRACAMTARASEAKAKAKKSKQHA